MPRFDLSQYSTVAERIDAFWAKYPNGRLHTELVHFSPEQCVIRAEVYLDRDDERPVTTDYAEERIDSSPVNRVSMVENCATSSLGRALADLGGEFTGAKRPSAEEMQKVARHDTSQKTRDWLTEALALTDVDLLRMLWAEAQQAGANPEVLAKVKAHAESIGSGSIGEGAVSGVQGKPARKRS
jgi:hypothetical protein